MGAKESLQEPLLSPSSSSDGRTDLEDLHSMQSLRHLQGESRRKKFTFTIIVVSFLGNILMAWFLWQQWLATHTFPHMDLAEDLNGIVPKMPRVLVTWERDSKFISMFHTNLSYEEKLAQIKDTWLSVIPSDVGMVIEGDDERYLLPPPITNRTAASPKLYASSAFHQLHCLYHILLVWHALYSNEPPPPEVQIEHMPHCFDYLRQSIMCSADTALEGADASEGGRVLGFQATHVCKNWDVLWDWYRENSYDISHWNIPQ